VFAPSLDRLALVVLHWPKHRDGRAFSQARALRAQGFRGPIRARLRAASKAPAEVIAGVRQHLDRTGWLERG
jgi:uncharacterized protein (DUF934 family)